MTRRRITLALVAIALLLLVGVLLRKPSPDATRVYIVSIVEIEPIAELRQGFKDVLAQADQSERPFAFTEFNAQGDSALINQIADQVVAERPDLVYVLGTPVAQAIQQRDKSIVIVQGAVTDPVEAGLSDGWEGSGRNYAATTDLPPVARQVALIRNLAPSVRRLGVIYNQGEANSVAVVRRLRTPAADAELELVERGVDKTGDVVEALESMRGNVDAIYLPPDNTVHAAMPQVGRFANEVNIPLFATVQSALEQGAVAAMAVDFRTLGEESGRIALQILSGTDPGTIPIVPITRPDIFIDRSTSEGLGLDIESLETNQGVIIVDN